MTNITLGDLFYNDPIGMLLLCGFIGLTLFSLAMRDIDPATGTIKVKANQGGKLKRGTKLTAQQRLDELMAQGRTRKDALVQLDKEGRLP